MTSQPRIRFIRAHVSLAPLSEPNESFISHYISEHNLPNWLAQPQQPNDLTLLVTLEAVADIRQTITSDGAFSISGPFRGRGTTALRDITRRVNQMLGRDPAQHRPPMLAWDSLIRSLLRQGLETTEQTLVDAPFEIRFDSRVQAALRNTTAD